MNTTVINKHTAQAATDKLNRLLLDKQGRIRLLPAATYQTINPTELRAWLHLTARYFIPTIESVTLIKQLIAAPEGGGYPLGAQAIEIGSGNGDLYHHLNIPGTDLYLHLNPAARAFYQQTQQPMTKPPQRCPTPGGPGLHQTFSARSRHWRLDHPQMDTWPSHRQRIWR